MSASPHAIVLRETDVVDLARVGEMLHASGLFPDIKTRGQAAVKVLAGRELGLSPIEAMRSLHVMDGKVELSADLLAQRVKSHPKYDYQVKEITTERCTLVFLEHDEDGQWHETGSSIFTIEDAKRANLQFVSSKGNPTPWTTYPRNMLFARAMSNGVAWFCPDVVGARVYVEGEVLGDDEADAYFNPEATAEELADARAESAVEVIEVPSHDGKTPDVDVHPDGRVVDAATGEILAEGVEEPRGSHPEATSTEPSGGEGEETGRSDTASGEAPSPPPRPTPSKKKALVKQKQQLAILAQRMSWDDDRRHQEAGVESFNDLDQATAAWLIVRWQGLAAGEPVERAPAEGPGEKTGPSGESESPPPAATHQHELADSPVDPRLLICTVEGCLHTVSKASGR